MKLAIVILNWNGEKFLKQFLPSVVQNSKSADVYVADNASTDNSINYLQSYYPEVKIIKNKKNGGYSKGYNDALKHIKADAYCLLNSDVEVTQNWLDPIIKTFNTHPNTAIIQPKILDYNKRAYFEYAGAAGGFIDKYAYPYCRGRIFSTVEKDESQYNDVADIFWASGACLFIRAEIFKNLNGLDELYFAHMEEIDLCWRAKNLGYTIKYVGTSTIYHVGGGTLQNTNPKKTFLNFRNSLFTLTKNANGFVLGKIFIRLILDGIAALRFLIKLKPNHAIAILKAHFSFYYYIPNILAKRKLIKTKNKYFTKTTIVFDYFVAKKTTYKNL